MGEHLAHILALKGWDITVTSRKIHKSEPNIMYIQGNAHELDFVESLFSLCFDVIVDFMVYNTEEFKLRYIKMLDACKQYIYLSSSRIYADSPLISEDSPRLLENCTITEYLKTDEYALAKAREENILRNAEQKNWTIIRPYITYNDERLQLGTMEKEAWLYRAIQGRTVVFTKDVADTITTMTYGYDVAKGIASIIGKESALGQIFHITQPNFMTWREVANIYQKTFKKITNREMKIKYLNNSKEFSEVFSNHWQVYCDRLYPRTFDNSKILGFLGEDYS